MSTIFLKNWKSENDVVQFADDTSIMRKFERTKTLEQTDNYLTENKLILNADKTEM